MAAAKSETELIGQQMRHVRFSRVIGLLVAIWVFAPQPRCIAQAQSDPAIQEKLQAGRDALASRHWITAIRSFQEANRQAAGSCEECYLGLAAAYSGNGQLQDAADSCDRALKIATDNGSKATAHIIKGKALVELAARDRELLAQAEAEFRGAAQIESANPLLHLWLGTVLLRESKTDDGIAELKKCLALDPPAPFAERAKLMLADPRRAGEEFAPNFRITTVQGQDLSLKQFSSRIVVLDFWATWCPPCRESVPELRDLTRKYDPAKLVLISVSADDNEDAWRQFIAENKMEWAQYRDADKKLVNLFTVRAYPTYLVIDGDGVITNRIMGANPQQSVVNQLVAILKTMPQLQGQN